MYEVSSEIKSDGSGLILVTKNERGRMEGEGVGTSHFIKDIDYNGMSKWKRKNEKEIISNSMVVFSEKRVLFAKKFSLNIFSEFLIHSLFQYCFSVI